MSPRRTAQLAVLGAQIRTLDPTLPSATAVAVRDGEILAVGSDDEIRDVSDARTQLIDGTGMAIVPGLTDSHIHPMWATDFAAGVDAAQFAVRTALADALRAERERVGPDAVVRAWSLDYAMFAGEDMHGAVLEEMAGGPALGVFFDLHTYLATPSVLAMADVTGAEPFPDASEIVVDDDGRPTGELR
jgi:predicted amidohydrolase YtcJ